MKNRRLTENEIKEIKELRKKGFSNLRIALRFGISESNVRYHCNEEYRKKTIKNAIKNRKKI